MASTGPMLSDRSSTIKRNPPNYLDLSSFAIPCTRSSRRDPNGTAIGLPAIACPARGTTATCGRNSLLGPTFKQWDFAIYKTTAITERVNMQFRADFFNLLNHPNFANPFLPAFIADPASTARQLWCGFSNVRQPAKWAMAACRSPPLATWASATRSSEAAAPRHSAGRQVHFLTS